MPAVDLAIPLNHAPRRHSAEVAAHASPSAAKCSCGARRPLAVSLGFRSGSRPQLEGQWFCKRGCLEHAVEALVRREFPQGSSGESRVRHRVPLGLLLQARGVISADDLRAALVLQQSTGQRLGHVLVQHFGVRESRIAAALASQWNVPTWHLPTAPPDSVLGVAPAVLFQSAGALPIQKMQDRLLLATVDNVDAALAFALERMLQLRVEYGVVPAADMERWQSRQQAAIGSARETRCTNLQDVVRGVATALFEWQPVESRAVRAGRRLWVRAWLEPSALDNAAGKDVIDLLWSLPMGAIGRGLSNDLG